MSTQHLMKSTCLAAWIVIKSGIWSLGLFGMLFQLGMPLWCISPLVVLGAGAASSALTHAHATELAAGELPEGTPNLADIFWLTIATMVFLVSFVGP